MRLNEKDRDKLIGAISDKFTDESTVSSKNIEGVADELGFDYWPMAIPSVLKDARVSRGKYDVAKLIEMAGASAPVKVVDFPTPKEAVVAPATSEN